MFANQTSRNEVKEKKVKEEEEEEEGPICGTTL